MAEIALGVIPLIGTAFTTYRSLHRHLRAFRHASKDLERTTKKFGVQKDRFKLECWLLLRSALEEHTITELEANEDFWNDPAVNAEFQLNFKSSYQSCYDIIEDVSQHLKEFEGELAEFAPLIKGREEVRLIRPIRSYHTMYPWIFIYLRSPCQLFPNNVDTGRVDD